jgi:ubiquinone/menaquinone biosynthesis C-methylase UbiE
MQLIEKNVHVFDKDVIDYGGYLTCSDKISTYFARKRLTDLTFNLLNMEGKKVIDIGCGDGTCTNILWDIGKPSKLIGIDPAKEAIAVAQRRKGDREIVFKVMSVYELSSFKPNSFDIVIMRGALHHLYEPFKAIKNILEIGNTILLNEPNGYNPILKIIEKTSGYHREHEEKSYPPFKLRHWVQMLGGIISNEKYAGLVPTFCPDWMAVILKRIEPVIEHIPGIRNITCGTYSILILKASMPK